MDLIKAVLLLRRHQLQAKNEAGGHDASKTEKSAPREGSRQEVSVAGYRPSMGMSVDPDVTWARTDDDDEGEGEASVDISRRSSFQDTFRRQGSAVLLMSMGANRVKANAWELEDVKEMGINNDEIDEYMGAHLPSPMRTTRYQLVLTILSKSMLRKVPVGSPALQWCILPRPRSEGPWVSAAFVLDKKRRVAAVQKEKPVTLPGRKGKKVDKQVSTAADYISCLLDPSSLDLQDAVSHIKGDGSLFVKLLQLSASSAEKLLQDVVYSWLEINMNVEYLRARELLQMRKHEESLRSGLVQGGVTKARTKRIERLIAEEEKTLAQRSEPNPHGRRKCFPLLTCHHLLFLAPGRHSQVLKLRAEISNLHSGFVRMRHFGPVDVPVRELDTIEVTFGPHRLSSPKRCRANAYTGELCLFAGPSWM